MQCFIICYPSNLSLHIIVGIDITMINIFAQICPIVNIYMKIYMIFITYFMFVQNTIHWILDKSKSRTFH
jgi:hypothetical protein